MKILVVLLIAASIIQAQPETAHKIPFASEGNSIELAVFNSSSIDIQNVQVEAIQMPEWIKFAESREEKNNQRIAKQQRRNCSF